VEITDVRVFLVDDEKLKAYVSIVFDRCFMVNDIRVVQGREGLFISMPSRKRRNGTFKDVAHPLNQETRGRFEERILAEYEAARSGNPSEVRPAEEPAADALEEVERRHLDDRFWGVV
jgi:stage V sporulation protein G